MRRDSQRLKVYYWEDTLPLWAIGISGARKCSLRHCRELINNASELYNLPKIDVRVPLDSDDADAYYSKYYICIPKHLQRKDVALHEAAHYIVDTLWPKAEDHGSVFVSVYMHLLHNLLGADIKWMESYASFCGLKFSTRKIYSPGGKKIDDWKFACLKMDINQKSFLKPSD
jgi:hypothetical protein